MSGVVFAASLVYVTARLDQFEDSVSSIVRIEVPSGVLADLPGTGDPASGGQRSSGAGGSNTPDNEPGSAGGAGEGGEPLPITQQRGAGGLGHDQHLVGQQHLAAGAQGLAFQADEFIV